MNSVDETLASIEDLLKELNQQEKEIDQVIEKKVQTLLAEKELEERKKEELDQFKADIAEKYRKRIREKIEKLESSKNDLLFLKSRYGNLISNL